MYLIDYLEYLFYPQGKYYINKGRLNIQTAFVLQ